MIRSQFTENSELSVLKQLELFNLTDVHKKRILKEIATVSLKKTRDNFRKQQTPTGEKFKPRKAKSKKKMQKGLSRYIGITSVNKESVTIGWKDKVKGRIAYRHAEGISEKMTAKTIKKIRGQPKYSDHATKGQAKELRRLGFKARVNGRKRKITIAWVVNNLQIGQAGIIIRRLRDKVSKNTWELPAAKRPFAQIDDKAAVAIIKQELKGN